MQIRSYSFKYLKKINRLCLKNGLEFSTTKDNTMAGLEIVSEKSRNKTVIIEGNTWEEVSNILYSYIKKAKHNKDDYMHDMLK